MLLPILGKSSLYIWFELNRNYVAEEYCVNKEREDCKGCCFLNEQIEKLDTHNDSYPISNSKNTNQKKDTNWDFLFSFAAPLSIKNSFLAPFQLFISRQHCPKYLAKINKPPCWVNSII
jgi:hypothetical protein